MNALPPLMIPSRSHLASMKPKPAFFVPALLFVVLAPACAQTGATNSVPENQTAVRGVNPADNITKTEILPKFTMIDTDNDVSVSTVTLKYDRAWRGVYGLNFELPLAHFRSPFGDDTGIGDFNVRGRFQHTTGRWTFLTGAEAVLPTATADTLGEGKLQLNPITAAVYAFSPQTFGVVTAKHLFGVAGDSDRADIVRGQYRIIFAYTTLNGWWFLADPQLWVDYHKGGRLHFAPEAEIGKMIGKTTGIWIRGGGHVAGNWRRDDWTISAGVRLISF